MVPHNDSQEKSRLPTSITQTWRNSFTTWSGTYVQKVSSTHSTKAAALQSPIPLSMNKGPRSSGPYPANGNDKANALGQQQQPSTCASKKKPLLSTCLSFRMIGLLPPRSITYKRGQYLPQPENSFWWQIFRQDHALYNKVLNIEGHPHTEDRFDTGYMEAST